MAANDATTLSVIDALLNVRRLGSEIHDQINLETSLSPGMKEFGSLFGDEVGGGRSVEVAARFGVNTAIHGVIGDDGYMARTSAGKYDKFTVPIYPVNMASKIGKLAQDKSAKTLQAIKSVLDTAQDDIKKGFPIAMARLVWGKGDGVLARVAGAPSIGSTTTITVDVDMSAGSGSTFGLKHIGRGDYIEFTSDKSLSEPDRVSVAQVLSTDTSASTMTVAGSIADVQDNDYICISRGLNNVPAGIPSVWPLFNTSGSYLSLSLTTYPELNPVRITGIASSNIEDQVVLGTLRVLDEFGEMPPMALTQYRTYRELFIDAKSDRRFTNVNTGATQKYALGYSAVTVTSPGGNPIEFFIDRFMPGNVSGQSTGMIAAINPKYWKWVRPVGKGPDWYRDESGSVLHQIPDTFGKKMVMLDHYNLICVVPRSNVFFEGITLS